KTHGDPKRVVGAYLTAVEHTEEQLLADTTAKAVEGATEPSAEEAQETPSNMFRATEGRWGSREIEITDVSLHDRAGQPTFVFHSGDAVSIHLKVRARQPADDFVFGIGLFNVDGVCCYVTHTFLTYISPPRLAPHTQPDFP